MSRSSIDRTSITAEPGVEESGEETLPVRRGEHTLAAVSDLRVGNLVGQHGVRLVDVVRASALPF